jgi:hypothetical protein
VRCWTGARSSRVRGRLQPFEGRALKASSSRVTACMRSQLGLQRREQVMRKSPIRIPFRSAGDEGAKPGKSLPRPAPSSPFFR